jgi:hypothetical protein
MPNPSAGHEVMLKSHDGTGPPRGRGSSQQWQGKSCENCAGGSKEGFRCARVIVSRSPHYEDQSSIAQYGLALGSCITDQRVLAHSSQGEWLIRKVDVLAVVAGQMPRCGRRGTHPRKSRLILRRLLNRLTLFLCPTGLLRSGFASAPTSPAGNRSDQILFQMHRPLNRFFGVCMRGFKSNINQEAVGTDYHPSPNLGFLLLNPSNIRGAGTVSDLKSIGNRGKTKA